MGRDRLEEAQPTGREDIPRIADVFVRELERILGENLHSAVIYGAAAFPDTLPTGDIDFHVLLHRPLTDAERTALEAMHEMLAKRFPPLGAEMDGYYLLLADARRSEPPQSELWARATDDAWALHRAHILAGRCLVLHGPETSSIYCPPTWDELEAALYGELAYVERHLYEYPDYCILNLCRLIYSFETHDIVVSKAGAARWAVDALPNWRGAIRLATASYERRASETDRSWMLREIDGLLADAKRRITACYTAD
jgi:hypothetical protein